MDPISDMLTQIRNALTVNKTEVVLMHSKFKESLAHLLMDKGWLNKVEVVEEEGNKKLKLTLKYDESGASQIQGLRRISKPGQRIYSGSNAIPRVKYGFGVTVVSTSKGLMTDKDAKREKVGGEVICQIW